MINKRIPLYDGRNDVALHTYLMEKDPMIPGEVEKMPAIIICPGGAYMFCSMAGEGDPVAMQFASYGYQVFVLQYTVGSTCGDHSAEYPTQIYDLAKAFLLIRENEDDWNVDTSRIALCGFSAGAHLCASFATRWHESFIAEHFNEDSASFKPIAAILNYPLTDYELQEAYNATLPPNPMLLEGNKKFLGAEHPNAETLKKASPYRYITQNCPPVFLSHATNDSLVPCTHSLKMAMELKEKNIPFELHLFQNGEHGYGVGIETFASMYRFDKMRCCGDWLPAARKWLLHIVAPETSEHDISSEEFEQTTKRA